MMMLNAFFLKTVLWVPSDHFLNVVRLLLWYSTGPIGMGEYYEYIAGNSPPHGSDSKTTGLESSYGYHCILCAATIVLESALWAKCGLAEFSEPFPWVVVFWWCVFGTIALHHDLF